MKVKTGLIIAGILVALFLSWWLLSYLLKDRRPLGYVRIAIDTSWSPIQFYHREQNVSYFSEELLSSIAENENFSLRFIPTESDFLYSGLLQGDFDAILSIIPMHTKYATKDFLFSNIYFPLSSVLIVSSSSKIRSIKDIGGKKIGFVMGSEAVIPFYKDPSIHLVPYDNSDLPRLIDNLLNNELDGAILESMLAYHYAERGIYQNVLQIVSPSLTNAGLGLIAKNSPQSKKLIQKFNEGLKALQEDGTYYQLLQKWDLPVSKEDTNP